LTVNTLRHKNVPLLNYLGGTTNIEGQNHSALLWYLTALLLGNINIFHEASNNLELICLLYGEKLQLKKNINLWNLHATFRI
jgi:hypothetical protein